MKKLLVTAGIASMAFLLSSCFTLQSFVIGAGALKPGKSTVISIRVHPASTSKSREYQFVLIGNDQPSDLAAGKAVWGANKQFGGPTPMVVQPGLFTTIGTDCDTSALGLSSLNTMTWKGYLTQTKIPDKGLVAQSAVITVGMKAKNGAASGDIAEVVGVTGVWSDATGDGPTMDDTFLCTGNGAGSMNII